MCSKSGDKKQGMIYQGSLKNTEYGISIQEAWQ